MIEVAPGLVQTEEFALNRLGDQDAAAKVYQGVEKPLTAEDVADVVRYAVVRTAPRQPGPDRDPPGGAGGQLQADPQEP